MNTITATGNYTVRRGATLTISAEELIITEGENATINGLIIGANGSAKITILFMNALTTDTAEVMTLPDGTFSVNFPTNSSGKYAVQASFYGSDTTFSADSNQLVIEVEEKTFFAKNGIYLGGGFFGAVGIAGLVMFIRKRRQ